MIISPGIFPKISAEIDGEVPLQESAGESEPEQASRRHQRVLKLPQSIACCVQLQNKFFLLSFLHSNRLGQTRASAISGAARCWQRRSCRLIIPCRPCMRCTELLSLPFREHSWLSSQM